MYKLSTVGRRQQRNVQDIPNSAEIRPVRSEGADALADLRIAGLRECPIALTADLDETVAQPREWSLEWASRDGRGRLAGMLDTADMTG